MVWESTPPITALRALWNLGFELPQVFRVEGLEILIIIDTNLNIIGALQNMCVLVV